MSNFHEFGAGKVQIVSGFLGELPGRVIVLTDIEEPMQMDVDHPAPATGTIELHSTVMAFPEKSALDRFIRILQDASDDWE